MIVIIMCGFIHIYNRQFEFGRQQSPSAPTTIGRRQSRGKYYDAFWWIYADIACIVRNCVATTEFAWITERESWAELAIMSVRLVVCACVVNVVLYDGKIINIYSDYTYTHVHTCRFTRDFMNTHDATIILRYCLHSCECCTKPLASRSHKKGVCRRW